MVEGEEMVEQEETFRGLIVVVHLQDTEEVFKEEKEALLVVTEEVLEALTEMGITNNPNRAAGLGALMIMAQNLEGAMVLTANSSIIIQEVARLVDMETVVHHQIPCIVHLVTTAKGSRTTGKVATARVVAVAILPITTRATIKGIANYHLIKVLRLPSHPTARAATASSINSSNRMEDNSGASTNIKARLRPKILVQIKVLPKVKGSGTKVLPKVKGSGASGIIAVVDMITLGGMDHKEEATETGV
nr:LOC495831 protein [synthetic construct]